MQTGDPAVDREVMRSDTVHGFFGADAVIVVLIAVGIRAVFIGYFNKKTGCAKGIFNAALICKNKAVAYVISREKAYSAAVIYPHFLIFG